jgi:hypothetical protein
MMQKLLFALGLAFFLISCGQESSHESTVQKFNGLGYVLRENSSLDVSESTITGEGSLSFTEPLGSVQSEKNFLLEFEIDDAGFVEIQTFSDRDFRSPISIRFSRTGETLTVGAAPAAEGVLGRDLKMDSTASKVSFSIDVHNSETPAHVMVWPEEISSPDDDNAVFNSDADGRLLGNGAGAFWGLRLKGASITKAAARDPKFSH